MPIPQIIGFAVAVGFLGVGVMAGYYGHQETLRQGTLWAKWAAARGWRYEARSSAVFAGLTALPFGRGHRRLATNVISGVWDNLPFTMYHYTCIVGYGRSTRTVTRSAAQFFCDADFPVLTIRSGPSLQLSPDIVFESTEFNDAFDVRCTDERFAFEVVHPRFMAALLDGALRNSNLTLEKGVVTVWRDNHVLRDSGTILPQQLAAVVALLPVSIWRDHGASAPQVTSTGPAPAASPPSD